MYYQTHNLDYFEYDHHYSIPTNTECIICFQNNFVFTNYTILKSFNYQKGIIGCRCNFYIHYNCINEWYNRTDNNEAYQCMLCKRTSTQIDIYSYLLLKKKLLHIFYIFLKLMNIFIFSFFFLTLFVLIGNIYNWPQVL